MASTSAFQLHQNKTSNARAGKTFRTYQGTSKSGKKGTYHVYADGQRVFVPSTTNLQNKIKTATHNYHKSAGSIPTFRSPAMKQKASKNPSRSFFMSTSGLNGKKLTRRRKSSY